MITCNNNGNSIRELQSVSKHEHISLKPCKYSLCYRIFTKFEANCYFSGYIGIDIEAGIITEHNRITSKLTSNCKYAALFEFKNYPQFPTFLPNPTL